MHKLNALRERGGSFLRLPLLLLLLFFSLPSVYAQENYKQEKISFQVKNEKLDDALTKLSQLANVRFFYNHANIDKQKRISLTLKSTSLEEVIYHVLDGQLLDVEFQANRTILLKPKAKIEEQVLMKLKGRVIDANSKEPISGASILLKERRYIGVGANVQGEFFIDIPQGVTAIIVSSLGYMEEEVKLDFGIPNMDIKLYPKPQEIEETVVTGMVKRNVESFTGNYVSVKGDDLRKLNPSNLLKALEFFDPSFQITQNISQGSNPNAMPEFQMRGNAQIGSLSGNQVNMLVGDYSNRPNMPLFIVDGFERSLQQIVDLDPQRVESITILKDAAASAIYGSRAANGVVVFETKKPLAGALNISYSSNMGITMPDLTDYNLMNAAEKLQFEYDAGLFTHDAEGNPLGPQALATKLNYYNHYKKEILSGVDSYWLSAPLRTAFLHRQTLAADGGDDAFRYSVNLNYGNNPGVMKESNRRNYGMGINLSYRKKKWNVNNMISINETHANESNYGSFSQYTKLNPYYRMRDAQGNYKDIIEIKPMSPGIAAEDIVNPLYNTQFPNKDLTKNFNVSNNFALEYAIQENFRISSSISISKGTAKHEVFKSANHTDFALEDDVTRKGSFNKDLAELFSWNANASVSYNWTRGHHLISSFGRMDIAENNVEGVNFIARGFPNDHMTDFLFAYEMENRVAGSESKVRSMGLIGQVSYMYDYRYAVDFSTRGDVSSQFGGSTRMEPFYAAGARWNINREKWFQGSKISNFVLQASYGITGSQNYDPYQAIESYSFQNMMFPYLSFAGLGAELMALGNPDLGWSKTTDRNVRVEMSLWDNRLSWALNYYNNYTDQLLLDLSIAPSTGFTSMTANVGALKNEGMEANLSFMPIKNFEKQIQWNLTLNAAHNRNTILKISNQIEQMNEQNRNNPGAPLPIYEEGKSTSQLFAVPSLGIDPATGREVFRKRNGEKTYIWDPADKVSIGDTQPQVRGALMSNLSWKNWSSSIAFAYQVGAYTYNQTLVDKIENINIAYNQDRRAAENRWRQPGDVAGYKTIGMLGHRTESSTRFVQKINEFRIGAISLGYRLEPKHSDFMNRYRISSININASANELAHFSTVRQERGLDYPFARTYNLTFNVLFR